MKMQKFPLILMFVSLCLQKKEMIELEAAKTGVQTDFSEIKNEFESNKAKVIDLLIENCINVDISIPRVVRGNFDEEEN